jgi:non-ribosomal peptide synthetase component F
LRELSIAYDAFAREATPILPELPICYSQYAQAQRAILSGARYDSLLQFWKNQLADLPTLEIPTDRPRPMRQSYSGGQCRVQYSPELVERLNKIAKDRHVTLHMLLLAAFQTLLHKHTGQSDLALGMPVAGRLDQAWEPLIGFFVNTLVIRTDLSGDPTFSALLQRTRTSCLATYDHQEMPFELLVKEIRPERTLNSNPLVQMIFQLTTMENTQLHFDGLDIQALDLDEPRVRFDLEVHLAQTDGGVRGAIHYAKDLFDASTIQRLSDHFHTILCSIAADPDQRLSELEWISEEEIEVPEPDDVRR